MRNYIIRVSDELLNLLQRYWALINERASQISCLEKFTENNFFTFTLLHQIYSSRG